MIKKVAIMCVTLLLLTVFSAGCTTSNNPTATPTETPTATPTVQATAAATVNTGSLGADKLAGAIDAVYQSKNYTVNTPFTMTKSGDTITYHGVVTDGPKVLTPYKRDITIVLTPTRTSARTIYQAAIDNQKAQGYQEWITSNSSALVYWEGLLGTTSSSNPATPKVTDKLNEPYSSFLVLPGSSLSEYLYGTSTKDYFEVTTFKETLAA
jgi:hypothetical protein